MNWRAKRIYILSDEEEKSTVSQNAGSGSANSMDTGTKAQYAHNANKFTSYSNTTGAQIKSYSFTNGANTAAPNFASSLDPEKIDVMIRTAPEELEGIQGLWKIAIESND